MSSIIYYFQVFLIGICIGSFLNVIVYRFQNNLSIIKPRSFCPKCKNKLTWKENIPLISWIIQKGKCLNCNTSISIKYPLIELSIGILFLLFLDSSPSLYSDSFNWFFNLIYGWIFLSLLVCIAIIDLFSYWIPQGLINFGFMSGFLGLIFMDIFNNRSIEFNLLFRGISASIVSFLIFESLRKFAKYIYKRDALGKGDSKLVAMMALWLGPLGIILCVSISYIFAAVFSLVGISLKLVKLKQVIPLAPFLALGGLTVWYLGNEFFLNNVLRI